MFRWVVSICVSCYEVPFEFDSAQEAEAFAKTVFAKMRAYDTDKDGAPRMARIYIKAEFIKKEDE